MSIPKKSRTTGELIPSVIFEFNSYPNYWLTKQQYVEEGGYKAVLKELKIPVGELKKVHYFLLNPQDFPTAEWEP